MRGNIHRQLTIKIQKNFMITIHADLIQIDTPATTLLVRRTERSFQCIHYGARLSPVRDVTLLVSGDPSGRTLLSFYGCGDYREPSVLVRNPDGTFVSEFVPSDVRITQAIPDFAGLPSSHGQGATLELDYRDSRNSLVLTQRITVYEDSDVLVSSFVLKNEGKSAISIRRLMSLEIDFAGTTFTASTFDGHWARERQRHDHIMNVGLFVNDSKQGSSSSTHNPYVLLTNNQLAGCYAFNLVYSGNHKEIIEATVLDQTHVLIGMSDFLFDWTLEAGESFCTPQAVAAYAVDETGVIAAMHTFVSNHILPEKWAHVDRPVLINNWEATYFNFNEQRISELAGIAAGVGIELFVLDDGWFGARDDDRRALGDWFDNIKKTGGGLGSLSAKIREKGLKFGIWVEPEMINEDSDLFRAHPEFAMRVPGKEPTRMRNQLMLDIANPVVQDYVIKTMTDVFTRCQADYVKWDYNRVICDVYSESVPNCGEYLHRYLLGLYRIMRELTRKFPAVLFESCAGGGSRYDLGLFCFMPQTWASDNTDAFERLFIQEGTMQAYPQNTMGSHVSICPNHQTGNSTPLETRFNVAAAGMFGYEMDLTKSTAEDLETIRRQVVFYKRHRTLLQRGRYIRLSSIFKSDYAAWIVVSEDRSEAMVTLVGTHAKSGKENLRVRLQGLDESAEYAVEMREQTNLDQILRTTVRGDILCRGAIDFGFLFSEKDRRASSNCISSRMVYLKMV